MKKNILTAFAISSLLVFTGCSSANSEPDSTLEPQVESQITESPTPSSAETGKKMTSEDFNKIDFKFKVDGASKETPYGFNYSKFSPLSDPNWSKVFSAKEVREAVKVGFDTYYNLRTSPALLKTDRTIESDDAVVQKYSKTIGSFLMDDWISDRKAGNLFSYAPLYPFLTEALYHPEDDFDSYKKYYVDTRETQRLSFDNVTASFDVLDKNEKPTIGVEFDEKAVYALENNGKGVVNSQVQLFVQKNSKGEFKLEGMFWTAPTQTMVDKDGKALPAK